MSIGRPVIPQLREGEREEKKRERSEEFVKKRELEKERSTVVLYRRVNNKYKHCQDLTVLTLLHQSQLANLLLNLEYESAFVKEAKTLN